MGFPILRNPHKKKSATKSNNYKDTWSIPYTLQGKKNQLFKNIEMQTINLQKTLSLV